jgi:hypothetical protein
VIDTFGFEGLIASWTNLQAKGW